MNVEIDHDEEVDYEFYNDASYVQIEVGLEEEDVEEDFGSNYLSQIRPTP